MQDASDRTEASYRRVVRGLARVLRQAGPDGTVPVLGEAARADVEGWLAHETGRGIAARTRALGVHALRAFYGKGGRQRVAPVAWPLADVLAVWVLASDVLHGALAGRQAAEARR